MPPQNQNLKNTGLLQGGNLHQNYQNKQSLHNSLPQVGGPKGYPIKGLNEFTMNRFANVPGLESLTMNRFAQSLSSKGESGLRNYQQGIQSAEARGEFAPSFLGKGGREFSRVPETRPRNVQISGPRHPGEWSISGYRDR